MLQVATTNLDVEATLTEHLSNDLGGPEWDAAVAAIEDDVFDEFVQILGHMHPLVTVGAKGGLDAIRNELACRQVTPENWGIRAGKAVSSRVTSFLLIAVWKTSRSAEVVK